VAGADAHDKLKSEEIAQLAAEIRERVRRRHPQGLAGTVALPDLMPILHARDAAESKVAAIGTVNPRAAGPVNALIQAVKRAVARALDWHVREQVEFNRSMVNAVEAVLDALDENNRALARLAALEGRIEEARRETAGLVQQASGVLLEEARELKDVRRHWAEWRQEWEKKLSINEVQFLRAVADLEAAFQHRATLMESNFRETARGQHRDFEAALDRARMELQERLWKDLEKVRVDYARLLHSELRLLRPRAAEFDPMWFAERFRGSEEHVREKQRFYVPLFRECAPVLDLGCGRGEFLELMRECGVEARGVDSSAECVALCASKGLAAEQGDLFAALAALPDAALGGIFCAQVVEHLPVERLPGLVKLAAAKLWRGGLLAVETPNPECLAALAAHFYLDPTHNRPVPAALLKYYFEEAGLGGIEILPVSPAVESMPSLAWLPQDFRDAFFGGLDYAILGRKL
jgi:O-antigen chain-terminating methyltransferase